MLSPLLSACLLLGVSCSPLLDSRYKRLAPGAYEAEMRAAVGDSPEIPFKPFSNVYVKKALMTPTNWTAKGKVAPVKDQGPHGYCGTFGRTAVAESQFSIKMNVPVVSFSEEALVDCIGWDQDQYSFFSPKGFMTSLDYPYNLSSYPDQDPPIPGNPCKFDAAKVVAGTDKFFYNGSTGHATATGYASSEDQLAAFIYRNGPVAIGINANVFGEREKGCEATGDCFITTAMCNKYTGIDHSITLVGYGTDHKMGDYWIVKSAFSAPLKTCGLCKTSRPPAPPIAPPLPLNNLAPSHSPPPLTHTSRVDSWSTQFANAGYINIQRGVLCAGLCDKNTCPGNLFTVGDPAAYYE